MPLKTAQFSPHSECTTAESDLYYLQSRYYDPELGRFINADGYISTAQGLQTGYGLLTFPTREHIILIR